MTKGQIGKGAAKFAGGAVGTAAIPVSLGLYDWRVIAAAAAVGGLGGLFGIDVAKKIKAKMPARKPA